MIRFVAFDFVLRIVLTRVMDITLIVNVARMHPDDMATDPARFGVPGHVITDFECLCHGKKWLWWKQRESNTSIAFRLLEIMRCG